MAQATTFGFAGARLPKIGGSRQGAFSVSITSSASCSSGLRRRRTVSCRKSGELARAGGVDGGLSGSASTLGAALVALVGHRGSKPAGCAQEARRPDGGY